MSSESPVTNASMHASERRSVGIVALISMTRMLGLFSLLPVLSLYAAELEGATPLLIGLAVGAYGLTQAGFQVPLGALSDRVGRLPVILLGLGIFAMGSVVAATSDSIYGVIAGRLLQGAGAISATLTALISDVTREQVRTRAMAVFGIGIGLSFVVAVVVGPLVAATLGVAWLFWIAAILAVIAALLLKLLPEIPRPQKSERWQLLPALRPELLRIDFYVFLLHTVMTATFVALPFLLSRRLEIALLDHWKMYIGALLLSLLIAAPMIMSDRRQGQGRLIGIAVSLILVAELLLTFSGSSVTRAVVALTLYFGGFNFLEAALPAKLSVLADDEVRGASLGVFSSAQFLGAFVGGLIGGRFLGEPTDVFFVCALLAGIWLASQGFGRNPRAAELRSSSQKSG